MMEYYDDMMRHVMCTKMFEQSKGELAVQSTPKEGPSLTERIKAEVKKLAATHDFADKTTRYEPHADIAVDLMRVRHLLEAKGVPVEKLELGRIERGYHEILAEVYGEQLDCRITPTEMDKAVEGRITLEPLIASKLAADAKQIMGGDAFGAKLCKFIDKHRHALPVPEPSLRELLASKPLEAKMIKTKKADILKNGQGIFSSGGIFDELPDIGHIPVKETNIEPKFTGWRNRDGDWENVGYCGAPSERIYYGHSAILGKDINLTTGKVVDETHCTFKCGGYMQQVYDTQRGLHRECQKCGRKK
jgi:hypothetical protein